jgi:hypothetical protein
MFLKSKFLFLFLVFNYIQCFQLYLKTDVTNNYLKKLYRPNKNNYNYNQILKNKYDITRIQSISFDDFFMNIYNIRKVIFTNGNNDKTIIELNNNNTYVYHYNNFDDMKKIKKIIYMVKQNISQIIITTNLNEYLQSIYGKYYIYNITMVS